MYKTQYLALLSLLTLPFFSFAETTWKEKFDFEFEEEACTEECPEAFCDRYRYVTLGVGPVIFIPNVGIGYRERKGCYGWDSALSFSTIGYANQFSGHLATHYYLNPSKQNSVYIGAGVLASGVFTWHGKGGFTVSPDWIVGKELKWNNESRHFLEMHVAVPTYWSGSHRSHWIYLPLMYIKYGFSF
ncbi:MAG: hypothetical protein ACK5MA_00855 [Parachlamydiaceae bacterium]